MGRVAAVGSWVLVENIVIAEKRANIMASMHSRAETRCVRCIERPRIPNRKAVVNTKYIVVIRATRGSNPEPLSRN